jgi:hypothetical protein
MWPFSKKNEACIASDRTCIVKDHSRCPFRTKEGTDAALKEYYESQKKKIEGELTIDFKKKEQALYALAAQQNYEFEHEFHSGHEKRSVELAKIDGEIAAKKESMDLIIKEKDKIIAVLLEATKNLKSSS